MTEQEIERALQEAGEAGHVDVDGNIQFHEDEWALGILGRAYLSQTETIRLNVAQIELLQDSARRGWEKVNKVEQERDEAIKHNWHTDFESLKEVVENAWKQIAELKFKLESQSLEARNKELFNQNEFYSDIALQSQKIARDLDSSLALCREVLEEALAALNGYQRTPYVDSIIIKIEKAIASIPPEVPKLDKEPKP